MTKIYRVQKVKWRIKASQNLYIDQKSSAVVLKQFGF